jgi:hypothetical protein
VSVVYITTGGAVVSGMVAVPSVMVALLKVGQNDPANHFPNDSKGWLASQVTPIRS